MNSIAAIFQQQARRTPVAPALLFGPERTTYGELNRRANAIASRLRARHIRHGHSVAVRMRHGPDLVAVLLGIAKVGAAYVGLDRSWPPGRCASVIEDCRPAVLVVDQAPHATAARDVLQVTPETFGGASVLPDAGECESDTGIFAIVYTSGSTGRPKGVLVTVASVMNRLRWMWTTYPFQCGDVALLHRAYSTVGFSWDCFGALLQGCPTAISPDAESRDPIAIVQSAAAARATHLSGSVGFWEAALDYVERHPGGWPDLRLARVSGESLPPRLVERWRRILPQATLLNIYGATECSGSVAYDTAQFDPVGAARVPVGTPVPGVQVFVVDDGMHVLGAGQEGEICVAGASLARGYVGEREPKAGRFTHLPHGPAAGTRVFRTGDVGMWREDGLLELRGRRDLQVKVRGFRVEIEEVEAALRRCPGVRAAAVYATEHRGSSRLTALLVACDEASARLARGALRDTLPDYMVPSDFLLVPELPRTPSGKIDRPALSGVGGTRVSSASTPLEPRSPSEAVVAAIWREMFGATLGMTDDFLDLGGDSLVAMRIISRLAETLHVQLALNTILENPTVAALAAEIDRLRTASPTPAG